METDLKTILGLIQLGPHEFQDKVVVITGAGGGIGLQAARGFALLGARVVIAELSQSGRAAEETIQREGGTALYIQTDVSDSASVARLAQATHDHFGPADILVNNAIRCPVAEVTD